MRSSTPPGFRQALDDGIYGDLTEDVVDAVLEEAGKFATEVIAPLNVVGDRQGVVFKDGAIATAPGWKEAYRAWAAAGWNGLAAPAEWGGQDLPQAVNVACLEMWNSAAMAYGIGPVLTMAAVDALTAHGSEELQRTYLPKLVSGEWTGTMQMTEPQAGSDVGALRTKAERAGDGTYRLTGQKIFITYGEHDMTDNIVHLVLARLARRARRIARRVAVPGAEIPGQCRRLARRAQRRARAFDRAQDGHPRLAHLHHGVRRQGRRRRLTWSAKRTAASTACSR